MAKSRQIWEMKAEKEQEIFRLIGQGLPKATICSNLGISPRTVERAFQNLRAKYEASDTFSLYSLAGTSLLVGELMATLETVINYCGESEVRRAAEKRLNELNEKYNNR